MSLRDENGQADIIDLLTMYPDARRRVVRLVGELEASDQLGYVREPSGIRPCPAGRSAALPADGEPSNLGVTYDRHWQRMIDGGGVSRGP